MKAQAAGSPGNTRAVSGSFQPISLPQAISRISRRIAAKAYRHLSITHRQSIPPILARARVPCYQTLTGPVSDAAQLDPPMQNWRLTLSYDGTGFSGWQIQPGERTVQGELQAALRRVTGESPLPQGSGRTDAGVHALGQVASFELQANIPPDNLLRALNRTLPAAIRILDARTARSAFHARHSTIAKTYEYRVFRCAICPPFLAPYVYAYSWPMDMDLLQRSAGMFVGEHDFLSFAATDPDLAARKLAARRGLGENPANPGPGDRAGSLPALANLFKPGKHGAVRTIFFSAWEQRHTEDGEVLIYRVRGNGFLHHMVRNLVGTMLDVGRGYTDIEAIQGMLAARSRDAAGPTAPAHGLFLHSVDYPINE